MTNKEKLRQCRYCDICGKETEKKHIVDYVGIDLYPCIFCEIEDINSQKKVAGDKTEFVLIEKPRSMRTGQAIMNAYRKQWDSERLNEERFMKDWKNLTDELRDNYNGFHQYAHMRMVLRYWEIWEQDTSDIQEKINNLNK